MKKGAVVAVNGFGSHEWGNLFRFR
jgi:hypothetical protein